MSIEQQMRISFETVTASELWRYSNVDPRFWSNSVQMVPNSEIAEEHWSTTPSSREGWADDILRQAQTIRQWIAEDRGFIRNLKVSRVETIETPVVLDEALKAISPDDA